MIENFKFNGGTRGSNSLYGDNKNSSNHNKLKEKYGSRKELK